MFATEHGLGKDWRSVVGMWLRVALAVRDADGHEILPEEALDDLPHMGEAVSQILRRAGMLQPRRHASPPPQWKSGKAAYGSPPPPPAPRSCRDCEAWMAYPRSLCQACQHWRAAGHPIGQCRRCRRSEVPLRDKHCRACLTHLSRHGPKAQDGRFSPQSPCLGESVSWQGHALQVGVQSRVDGHVSRFMPLPCGADHTRLRVALA